MSLLYNPQFTIRRGEEQGGKSPSSLNGYVSFSPSSLLFPPVSPSSQLFLGHFSLLPILFLPPLLVATVNKTDETGTLFLKKCLILPLTFLLLTNFKTSHG